MPVSFVLLVVVIAITGSTEPPSMFPKHTTNSIVYAVCERCSVCLLTLISMYQRPHACLLISIIQTASLHQCRTSGSASATTSRGSFCSRCSVPLLLMWLYSSNRLARSCASMSRASPPRLLSLQYWIGLWSSLNPCRPECM